MFKEHRFCLDLVGVCFERAVFRQVHKSVATSPIQDPLGVGQDGRRTGALPKGTHVRFLDTTEHQQYHAPTHVPGDSSESETENTVLEEDGTTSEKFLLLIDQLSVDQKRHLSIKDIGLSTFLLLKFFGN